MIEAALKASSAMAPPATVSVSGFVLLGVAVPDWVLIITAVLGIGNLYVLVRDKFVRDYLERRRARHERQPESSE
jgi:hypothetical protein